jgi:hypothetical protein
MPNDVATNPAPAASAPATLKNGKGNKKHRVLQPSPNCPRQKVVGGTNSDAPVASSVASSATPVASSATDMCKYAGKCTNPKCKRTHPEGYTPTEGLNAAKAKCVADGICFYKMKCTNTTCKLSHPDGYTLAAAQAAKAAKASK